jgi:hypothetical protein
MLKKATMNNTDKLKTEKCYLSHYLNYVRQIPIVLFFLLCNQIYAQQETKPRNFGVHVGLNSGMLSGGIGPSFSLHYAFRTEKVLQLESMLFFDSHSGKTFLSGESQKNVGLGVAAGMRLNVLPQKKWNPSLVIMPGVIYSSETTSRYNDNGLSGISGTLCFAVSSAFDRKHMVSIGLNQGANILATYLKYGFWF